METNTQEHSSKMVRKARPGPKQPQRRRPRGKHAPRMFQKHPHRSINGVHRLKATTIVPTTNRGLSILVRCRRAVSRCGPKNARNKCVNCGTCGTCSNNNRHEFILLDRHDELLDVGHLGEHIESFYGKKSN